MTTTEAMKGEQFFELVKAGIRIVAKRDVPERMTKRVKRKFSMGDFMSALVATGEVARIPYQNLEYTVEALRTMAHNAAADVPQYQHCRTDKANGLMWIWFDLTPPLILTDFEEVDNV